MSMSLVLLLSTAVSHELHAHGTTNNTTTLTERFIALKRAVADSTESTSQRVDTVKVDALDAGILEADILVDDILALLSQQTDSITLENVTGIDSLILDSLMLGKIDLESLNLDSTQLNALAALAESAIPDTPLSDSLSLMIDSLLNDTIIHYDSLGRPIIKIDTAEVIGGVLPLIKESRIENRIYAPVDTVSKKKVKIERPFSALAMERSPIFKKDTIGFGRVALTSIVVPGFSQLYNGQYAKIPMLYASVGALATGAVISSKKYNAAKSDYNAAVDAGTAESGLYSLHGNMTLYNNYKTAFIAGTVLTYMYFLSDGITNYKGEIHPTSKATLLSALFPGAGQIYNQKYWKLPIVYGGFATFAFVLNYNNRGYVRYSAAYNAVADGDDSTVDEFNGVYSATLLQNTRDSFRRYRDMSILMLAGFYLIQIIDAHVDGYLANYDISDDLAMDISPTFINSPYSSSNLGTLGMGLKIKF